MERPAVSPRPDPVTATSVLSARALVKRYGSRTALAGVSLAVKAGELVAVIGPNGAGKTTLLSLLAGLAAPDEGEIFGPAGKVGWVPQGAAVYGRLTVRENLELFAQLEAVDDPERRVAEALAACALEERAAQRAEALSGGLKQRLNLAIGLLADPSVLLLDEPTTALDPRQRDNFWSILSGLAGAGTAIVYTTHLVHEAEQYADRVLVIADGELLFEGSPGALAAAVGAQGLDFEQAFVRFLHARGH